jgi:hypothetical protein
MRRLASSLAALAIAIPALAEDALPSAPRTIALLAAMGSQFNVMHEEQQTGSRLPPYRTHYVEGAGEILNRLVLNGLDKAVARVEPESRRVFLSASASIGKGIEPVVTHLATMDRSKWDRIVVATPAYRPKGHDGLPTHMEGIGVFWQVLCESNVRWCSGGQSIRPMEGPVATTPEGEEIFANTYVAPFTFVDIWVLDPKSLAVLDKTTSFGHRKLADTTGRISNVTSGGWGFVAVQFLEQLDASVLEAVEQSALRGSVEVRERGPVK